MSKIAKARQSDDELIISDRMEMAMVVVMMVRVLIRVLLEHSLHE